MENSTTKTLNLANLPDKEISLDEAYAQSADQDKLIEEEFTAAIADGLMNEPEFTVANISVRDAK